MRRLDGFGRPCIGAVDLVDHDDRRQPQDQRLAKHHSGLWHRPLDGINQEQASIRHAQHAFDFAAEIGVAGRIDDVDLDSAIPDRRRLGQDRDALLAFQGVGIHDQLAHVLVGGEDVGLLQEGIDQRGLAVIDVGNDGHVSQIMAARHLWVVETHLWH